MSAPLATCSKTTRIHWALIMSTNLLGARDIKMNRSNPSRPLQFQAAQWWDGALHVQGPGFHSQEAPLNNSHFSDRETITLNTSTCDEFTIKVHKDCSRSNSRDRARVCVEKIARLDSKGQRGRKKGAPLAK